MTTLESLLRELGKPPSTICLDWAWQLQQLCGEQRHAENSPSTPLTWRDLELNETGQLKLIDDAPVLLSPDELLRQLISWSTSDSQQLEEADASLVDAPSDLSNRLQALTLVAFDTEVTVSTSSVVASSTPDQQTRPRESPVKLKCDLDSSDGASRVPRNRQAKSRQNQLSVETRLRQRRLVVVSLAVCALIPIAVYMSFLAVDRDSSPSAQGQASSGKPATPVPTKLSPANPVAIQDVPNATWHNSPESPSEISLSSPKGYAVEPNVNMSLEQNAIGQLVLPKVDLSPPQAITNTPRIDANQETSEGNSVAEISPPASAGAAREVTAPELAAIGLTTGDGLATDVMSELASVSKSAETLAVESEFAATADSKDKHMSEPLIINTTPAVQIHKLPAKLATRPRQPIWRLAMAVDDGFTVSPSEPQVLTERAYATWVITSDDAKTPRTSLAVQVQMSSGRQAALKWKIVATTEDFPNLSLPLGATFLQPLQERLRLYTHQATQETDRLKQLAASGLPGDLRTAVNQQRAASETQAKVAGRLLTFVASAQQLDNWLHGHVAIFAELRDGTTPDSALILQFGELADLLTAQTEKDPASKLEDEDSGHRQ